MPYSVSICIPTYNRPKLLEEAIRSCAAQTRLPDEVLIGDDSPSDETAELVERLRAEIAIPLRYDHHVLGLGQNENINSLFRRATSSHLILLHDDDLLTPNAVEDLIGCWELHPELTGAYGKQYVISADGTIDPEKSEAVNRQYRRTDNEAGLQPYGWEVGLSQQFPNNGYMVRTEAAQAILWRPTSVVGNGGDFDFGLRLGLQYEHFFFLNRYTSMYRLTAGGSISSSKSDDAALFSYRNVSTMELPEAASVARREKLTRSAAHAMMQALHHGHKREAWDIYRSAHHPWRVRLSLGGVRRLLLLLKP